MIRVCLLLALTVLLLGSSVQGSEPGRFSINYMQRLHFVNFQDFADIQDQSLPRLKDNTRFHGMRLEGTITDDIIVGLYANGSLNDSRNNNGYTSFGGGVGVVTIEKRYYLPGNCFAGLGFGLGCSRFTYSSAKWDGSESITSNTDAIFGEPGVKLGYIFWKKLILIIDASYMLDIAGNRYTVGAENIPDVFPEGWFAGVSIGYYFPYPGK